MGTGTVGGGVILVLKDHEALITERVGTPIRIKKVLARHPEKVHALDPSLPVVTDIEEITGDPDIDIVVELIGREHPALEYMKKALLAGKNVVTPIRMLWLFTGKNSLSWQQPTMSIFFLRHRWLGESPLFDR